MDLKVLKYKLSLPKAELIRNILKKNGIHSFLQTPNYFGMNPGDSPKNLIVAVKDFERANEIVKSYHDAKSIF